MTVSGGVRLLKREMRQRRNDWLGLILRARPVTSAFNGSIFTNGLSSHCLFGRSYPNRDRAVLYGRRGYTTTNEWGIRMEERIAAMLVVFFIGFVFGKLHN